MGEPEHYRVIKPFKTCANCQYSNRNSGMWECAYHNFAFWEMPNKTICNDHYSVEELAKEEES